MGPLIHDSRGRAVTFEKVIDLVEGAGLRDQFAMAALTGICASGPGMQFTNELLAKEAYQLADAMIKARGEK